MSKQARPRYRSPEATWRRPKRRDVYPIRAARLERYGHFGRWLHERITELGLSRTAFAAQIQTSTRALDQWLTGARYPSTGKLLELRAVLHCSGDALLNLIALDMADRQRSGPWPAERAPRAGTAKGGRR